MNGTPDESAKPVPEGSEQPISPAKLTSQGTAVDTVKTDTGNVISQATQRTQVAPEQRERPALHQIFFQVEDEPLVAKMTEHALKDIGMNCAGVGATLEDALEKLTQCAKNNIPITIVYLDQQFPQKKRGGEPAENFVMALDGLQKDPQYSALAGLRTIIFFTGTGDEAACARLQALLPNHTVALIRKPVRLLDLQTKTASALWMSKTINDDEFASALEKLTKQP